MDSCKHILGRKRKFSAIKLLRKKRELFMDVEIIIRKGLKLGELDAEADSELLDSCFVDNGQLAELLDIESPSSVILGRTGAGKSALLYKISKEVEHSSFLDPNDISIRFLEHSNICLLYTSDAADE